MTNPDRVALSALPRELTAFTGRPSPNYRRLYALTLDGVIPAQQVNGRWHVLRADLAQVANLLGMATAAPAAKASRRQPRQLEAAA